MVSTVVRSYDKVGLCSVSRWVSCSSSSWSFWCSSGARSFPSSARRSARPSGTSRRGLVATPTHTRTRRARTRSAPAARMRTSPERAPPPRPARTPERRRSQALEDTPASSGALRSRSKPRKASSEEAIRPSVGDPLAVVEPVEDRLVADRAGLSLHLERRRQVAGLLREVVVHDVEPLELVVGRLVSVQGVDDLLDGGDDLRARGEIRVCRRRGEARVLE